MVGTLGQDKSENFSHLSGMTPGPPDRNLIMVYLADGTDAGTRPHPGHVLRQTLAMAEADTEDELLHRTLVAARELSHTGTAMIIYPDGATLGTADPLLGQPGIARARIGDAMLVVADAPADLTGLIAAHATVYLDRLRRLDVLHERANSDPLTGLRHHRPFSERLAAARPGRTAVIAIDVDGFKRINDEYGHQAGDHALVRLGGALQSALRAGDELYRIGGDEFAVVVDVQNAQEALSIADRLLHAARATGHPVSVGAALCGPDEEGRATLRRADMALYEAKRSGRDKVRLAA
jgi:diguanylate cyclase (GGDEF)-like protein